ncbi:MAG: hypothetical protein GX957_07090 [Clostridiaceae bacterium]|nr:hypothetical protein [Clostridiaceae bacterium]
MQYIRRLPLLLALASGILTGIAGYLQKISDNENIFKMAVVMFIFYIAGFMIRNTILTIVEEQRKKAEELERAISETDEPKEDSELHGPDKKGQNLDLTADESIDFDINNQNLEDVANFIKNELHQ